MGVNKGGGHAKRNKEDVQSVENDKRKEIKRTTWMRDSTTTQPSAPRGAKLGRFCRIGNGGPWPHWLPPALVNLILTY